MPDRNAEARSAVSVVNEGGASPFVLTCEHASNHIPRRYAGLGLAPEDLERHIAWDIGAAELARRLSDLLDAPLFLAGYSRLLIDCNRPPDAPSSIPGISEDTAIPGNQNLSEAEAAYRLDVFFTPFQDRIARHLDRRAREHKPARVVGIHSFTPVYRRECRPWHAGVLYGKAARFGQRLHAALARETDLEVGDNEPYRVTLETDYTVPVHGDARSLDAALIEVRQDLLGTREGIRAWAERLARALGEVDGS